MTELEVQVSALKVQLERLEERVRLDAVAEMFVIGQHEVRRGDYFILNGWTATKLTDVSSDGKWTYFDGHNTIEPFRIPSDVERLYRIAEVHEIVVKAIDTVPLVDIVLSRGRSGAIPRDVATAILELLQGPP